MKAAFLSEFLTVRSLLLQMLGIYLAVGVFVSVGMQSVIGMTATISAMAPILMVFSFSTFDAANGWERYRATLPVARANIVASRYLNVLAASLAMFVASLLLAAAVAGVVGTVAPESDLARSLADELAHPAVLPSAGLAGMSLVLLICAIILPPVLRFGMTKAMRYIPVAMLVVLAIALLVLPNVVEAPAFLADFMAWADDPANTPVAAGAFTLIVLAAYAASCVVAVQLYRSKDL